MGVSMRSLEGKKMVDSRLLVENVQMSDKTTLELNWSQSPDLIILVNGLEKHRVQLSWRIGPVKALGNSGTFKFDSVALSRFSPN